MRRRISRAPTSCTTFRSAQGARRPHYRRPTSSADPTPTHTVKNATGTKIDYGQLTPYANNTTNLIQQVNNVLLFGTMPPGMKLAIKNAIDIPALGGPAGPYTAQQLPRPRPDRGVPRHRFAQVPTGVLT